MKPISTNLKLPLQILARASTVVRHLLLRLINNDVLVLDRQHRVNLITLLTLLPALAGVVAHLLLRLYLFGLEAHPSDLWLEKTYFMTITMAFMGMVFTVLWEHMSLDRTELELLLPHPMSGSLIILSKWIANMIFAVAFALILNLFSTPIFVFYITKKSSIPAIQLAMSHLFSQTTAALFVFFWIALIQTILNSGLSTRWYRLAARLVRVILFTLFISLWLWFPTVYSLLPFLKESRSLFVYLYPPLWFVGWGEFILGHPDSIYYSHTQITIMALTLPLGLSLICLFRQFRRNLSRHSETPRPVVKSRKRSRLTRALQRRILPHPLERAMFHFTLASLNRNPHSKLMFFRIWFLFVLLGAAVLTLIYARSGPSALQPTNPYLVALSILAVMGTVHGIRTILRRPLAGTLPEPLTLQLPGYPDVRPFLRGFRKAVLTAVLLPMVLLQLLLLISIWPPSAALYQSLYCLVTGLLLIHLSLLRYPGIPFFSAEQSGKMRRLFKGAARTIAASASLYVLTQTGMSLLRKPEFYPLFYLLVLILFFLSEWLHHFYHHELLFTYDRAMNRVMVKLVPPGEPDHRLPSTDR